ncbi:hypothetical protein R1flu_014157 [Riccia fluitans]|uniref:Peroxidase n=1 Tax=Riccia fluitans TaxID=41844 RepID=A0ABD1YFB0_9MARC
MELYRRGCVLSLLGLLILASAADAYPSGGYYSKSCPNAVTIIKKKVTEIVRENKNIAGGLLRLHFHDCFVRGCDASVLLNSPNSDAEKDALPNAGVLRGFDEIDRIKAAVEAECAGVVSCADILALAARDATVLVGAKSWEVNLGRKDGLISKDTEANAKLPNPLGTFDELVQNFGAVGLSQEEMVVLSGGHTIGRSSCRSVEPRLYNFSGVAGSTDPSIDPKFAAELKKKCPKNQQGSILSMDPTKNTFDLLYFKAVLANKGLFESDANLLTSAVGKQLVRKYSKPGSSFLDDFAAGMRKMSNIGWGSEGEVRKVCSAVNH